MNLNFSIEPQTIHLWHIQFSELENQEKSLLLLLSPDEIARADRFRFPIHRLRFILARGILRKILSFYTGIPPAELGFSYGPRGKPYLKDNKLNLQFNVSHSDDLAVYGFTLGHELGVDIEKISPTFKAGVAKRFFSEAENQALSALPEAVRAQAFYRIWAGKEAIIKAVGEGLYVPLGDITIHLNEQSQWITLDHAGREEKFYLENFSVHPDYQSAFATRQKVTLIKLDSLAL